MVGKLPRIGLDHWIALQAVVDHGGFAQAAEALNKSQSSVSYAIKQLQTQLPVPVLAQQGRKAELTEAGELLLRRSRALVQEALSLERMAESLAQGWEPEVRLAVEIIFPPNLLLEALSQFAQNCRASRIQLVESVLSGTVEALLSGEVDLVVSGRVPPGFIGEPLMPIEFVAVAHRDHPLNKLNRDVTIHDLKAHRQLVVRDSGSRRRLDSGWLGAEERWTVSHMKTSIQALKNGLGFAWVPREHIRDELRSGELKPVALPEGGVRKENLYLVYPDRESAGPATRELAQIITSVCKAACRAATRQAQS